MTFVEKYCLPKIDNLQFHLVTFAANTSITEEHANVVASSSEPDVISLSDGEGSENLEVDTEFALLEQAGDNDVAQYIF